MSKTRVKVYAYLVYNELRTIEEIPKRFREAVLKEVAEMEKGNF
ncbi:MAG: CD1375 family protein [Ezakiella sp.]|nr:CD1375 family protein [Ezakiella sp.]